MQQPPKDKKKTARGRLRNPGLRRSVTSRVRREYLDCDYIHKLSPEDKDWLSDFLEETLHASPGKRFITDVQEKRDIYKSNYARKNDIQGVARQEGLLNSGVRDTDSISPSPEDALIKAMDMDIMDVLEVLKEKEKIPKPRPKRKDNP